MRGKVRTGGRKFTSDKTDERKRSATDEIVKSALRDHGASISFRVVQETLNAVARRLPTPLTVEDAKRFVEWVLAPLWRSSPGSALYHRGLKILARHRYGFYDDSLIVAAALDAGCTPLYSQDPPYGQRMKGLTIENPSKDE